MLRFYFTAILTTPSLPITAAYMAASANAVMKGPDTVPPGRSISSANSSLITASPSPIDQARMPMSWAQERCCSMMRWKSSALSAAKLGPINPSIVVG